MASSSLVPKKSESTVETFALQNTSAQGATYSVAGRGLALPKQIVIQRKVGPSGSTGNDHVIVRVVHTDANATTGKPVTSLVSLDISIPRDTATITPTEVVESLGILASLLNDSTALAATTVARTALVEGRDL